MKKKFKLLTGPKIGLLASIFILGIFHYNPAFLNILELKTLDLRFQIRGKIDPGKETAIVTIDDKSIDALGRWPWPRRYFAQGVRYLKDAGAKVIGFDILFTEPDKNPTLGAVNSIEKEIQETGIDKTSPEGEQLLKFVQNEKATYDNDTALADALNYAENVILPMYFSLPGEEYATTIKTLSDTKRGLLVKSSYELIKIGINDPRYLPLKAANVTNSIEIINKEAACEGCVNMVPDVDGGLRWELFAVEFEGDYYPPITLQLARSYLGLPMSKVKLITSETILMKDIAIPLTLENKMLINYCGPNGTFPYYSFIDIFERRIPPELIKDKIILLGATAPGLGDMKVTPFTPCLPGVEKHANVIQNILHKNFLRRNFTCVTIDILFIIGFGVLMGIILGRLSTVNGTIVFIASIFAFSAFSQILFSYFKIVTNIIYPFLTLLLCFTSVTVAKLFTEEKEKKKIKEIFGHYASEQIVTQILANPDSIKLGGEKRVLTILFCDIQNFTSISETLEPEEVAALLNRYLTRMTQVVYKHGGTIDKFMGDAIMVLFSAPLYNHKHPLQACQVAIDMIKTAEKLNSEWKEKVTHGLKIRIGINTGEVIVGNMGSEALMDYTAIGDAVNITQRMEQLNKKYNTNIIIGEETYNEVKDEVDAHELGIVQVKGKNKLIKIYELKALKNNDL